MCVPPRLAALFGALFALACGGAEGTAPGGTTPLEWAGACEGPTRDRMERFRQLAYRSSSDEDERAALEAWRPRGREGSTRAAAVPDMDLQYVLPVVRRAVAQCGRREAIELTSAMVAFQTVRAIEDNPEFERMSDWLAAWAETVGLRYTVVGDNDVWEIELPGRSDARSVAIVTHADVVPVNDPPALVEPDAAIEGWRAPPFTARVRASRLYGRGSEDDKGPIAAALVSLAALRDAGVTPAESFLLIAGTGEEHDWDPMIRYVSTAPPVRHVLSADAEFPVVVAESGFVSWGVRTPLGDISTPVRREGGRLTSRATAVDARGGLFLTQVPGEAELILVGPDSRQVLRAAREAALSATERRDGCHGGAEYTTVGDETAVRLFVHGVSVHSSTPEAGHNALWLLADAAETLELTDNGIRRLLHLVHERFVDDHRGHALGLAAEDSLMGPLILAPTLLRVEDGEVRLRVNLRRPRPSSSAEFRTRLDEALERLRTELDPELELYGDPYVGEPHVTSPDSHLVHTLLDIYREHRGDPLAQPLSIRGGTYARLYPGAVSFGPSFPDHVYSGHGADEYIGLHALGVTTAMYLDAFLRLGVSGGQNAAQTRRAVE